MKLLEAAQILLFKIVLPTVDIFSDWFFGIHLILGWGYDFQCNPDFAENHVYMGIASVVPASLSAFIHLHHWYHFEKVQNGGIGRIKTLPMVLLQVLKNYSFPKQIGRNLTTDYYSRFGPNTDMEN